MTDQVPPRDSRTAESSSELSEDDLRIWDELWTSVHNDHYGCYYEELVAEYLVSRWRLLDTVTKFLTALTASGSTVAAWSVWTNSSGGGASWAILSGVAAIIALIHMSLSVSDRIKEDTLIFSTFQQLRLDLENLKKKMTLDRDETLTAFLKDYLDVTSKFGKSYALKRPDFFLSVKREKRIQDDLNKRLGLG